MGLGTWLRKNLSWMKGTSFGNKVYHLLTDNWEQRKTAFANWILPTDDNTSSDDTSVTENPAISGAKNTEGTDKVIPLTLGKHILSPYYCGKPYHSIDSKYGETQTYHALFNLGYRNTDVSRIRLGWIDLSSGNEAVDPVVYTGFGNATSLSGDYFTDSVNTDFLLKLMQNVKTTSCSITQCGETTDYLTDMSVTSPAYSNGKISVGSYGFKYLSNEEWNTYSRTIPATLYIPVGKAMKVGTLKLNVTGNVNIALGEIGVSYNRIKLYPSYIRIEDVFDCYGNADSNFSLAEKTVNADGTTDLTINFTGYSKIKINSTTYRVIPITFFEDVQINSVDIVQERVVNGDLAIDGRWSATDYNIKLNLQTGDENPLYPQKVVEEELNVELIHLNDSDDDTGTGILLSERFSAKNPMKTEIEFDIAGLFAVRSDDEGKKSSTSIQICIQYSLDGGTTWKNYGCPTSTAGVWSTVGTNKSLMVHGVELTGLDVYGITLNRNKEMRFNATREYTYDEAMNASNRIIEFRIFRYNNEGAKADGTSEDSFTDKIVLTYIRTWCFDYEKSKGSYDVDTKTYQYWDATNQKWTGGSLVAQTPMSEKKRKITTTLGFQVDADQNEFKNQLNDLNCLIQSYGRTCQKVEETDESGYVTGYHYEWSDRDDLSPTSNPASLVLMIMQHESREKYAYDDDKFDLQSFGKLYEYCSTAREEFGKIYPKFACNGVITSQTKTLTIVNDILSVCRAKLRYENNKFSVFMDNPDTENTLVLNNRNIMSFSVKKAYDSEIDGVKISFENEDNNYEKDEMKVLYNDSDAYDDTKADKLVYASLDMKYQTSPSQIYQNAKYYLATKKLHPETWEIKTSVDAHLLKMGSRIGVQSDTISVGIGDGGEVTGFSLNPAGKIRYIHTDCNIDSTFYELSETENYALVITQTGGSSAPTVKTHSVKPVIDADGFINSFRLETPIDADAINKGDIVSFGTLGSAIVDCVVFGKKDNGDDTFTITATPYLEELYNADTGEIPEFDSKVTRRTGGGSYTSPTATLLDVDEYAEKNKQYIHYVYNDELGIESNYSTTESRKYIGIYTDNNSEPAQTYAEAIAKTGIVWSQLEGAQGIAGERGADGKTTYLHIAYANSADGKTDFSISDSTDKKYLGQYHDETEIDSTDPAAYTWTLIKGSDGEKGDTGEKGEKGDKGDTGATGAKGATGATGISVTSTLVVYQANDSTSSAPTKPTSASNLGNWKTSFTDIWGENQALWYCEITTYSNGTCNISEPSIIGVPVKAIASNTGFIQKLFAQDIILQKGGDIQSNNYVAGTQGWKISYDGNSEFQDTTIRGRLQLKIYDSMPGTINEGDMFILKSEN